VYDGGVSWQELCGWLQEHGFVPLWPPAMPHDDVLFVRSAALERVRGEFQSDHYLRHNARRLEHLASLNLPLRGKRVLEVGAGIGDHTSFYVDRGCTVTTTEVRPENLLLIEQRFRNEPAVTVRSLDMEAPTLPEDERYDVIHCYGLLYHLRHPERAIRFMARHGELLLLETCVSPDGRAGVNTVEEPASQFSQSFYGAGCRPHEQWVLETLRKSFRSAEIAATQPDHPEFATGGPRAANSLLRRVFIARHGEAGA
jgi:ubiquinone/menaquinone biosynthesis C-methylase UbiE